MGAEIIAHALDLVISFLLITALFAMIYKFLPDSGRQSPIFNVQLPAGNLFGVDETIVPELVLSPSAEQGYYLFVRPLTSGNHTIRWISSGCVPGLSQDITYHLTMLGAGPNHWQHRRWKVTRLGHPVLRKVTEEI